VKIKKYLLLLLGLCLLQVAIWALKAPLSSSEPTQQPLWSYQTGGKVWSTAISADGNYVVAGGDDNRVYLFSRTSSTPIWSYQTGNEICSVSISSNGAYLVSGGEDNKVYLFSKDSSTPVWSYTTGSWIMSVKISSDGNYIAVGSEDNKVYLFSKDSSTPVWSYQTGGEILSVAISSDGSYIAAGGNDDKVYLFRNANNTPYWSYTIGDDVLSVAISSDGSCIVAGSKDDNFYVFDQSGNKKWSYKTGYWVWSVSISQDGYYMAAGSLDFKVYLFSTISGTLWWSHDTGSYVYSVSMSSNGSYITAGSWDYQVYLFEHTSSTPLWNYQTGGLVYPVSISSTGAYITAGGDDNKVYLFSRERANTPPTLSAGSVNPSSGTTVSTFDYTVTYMDADGDAPSINVYIDGAPHQMNKTSGAYLSGAVYDYTTTLSAGLHTYYFEASDGTNVTRLPTSGSTSGPMVTEVPKISTTLVISPSSFTISSGGTRTFTTTLAGNGTNLSNKTITWGKNAGSLSSSSSTTDSSGQASVVYTAPSTETTTTVTISASFAGDNTYASSSANSSGTVGPLPPLPTLQIESEYNGFFLQNVSVITNTYRAVLSSETSVSSVVFQMGGDTQTDTSSPYEATYNMGSVGLTPTLNVTVNMSDGRTVTGSVSPKILETPSSLSQMINFFNSASQVTLTKKTNGYWKMDVLGIMQTIAAGMEIASSPVAFGLGAGGYSFPIPEWRLGFTIESDDYNKEVEIGAFDLSMDDIEFMSNGGLSFNVGFSGNFTVRPDGTDEISDLTLTVSIGGSVSWTMDFQFVVVVVPVIVHVTPHFDAELDLGFGLGNPITIDSVGGNIGGGVDVSAGVGVSGASAGAYGDISIHLYFVAIPSFDFQKVRISGSVGLYAELLLWEGRLELWSGEWSSNPGDNTSRGSTANWELIDRDYLGPGYSTFAWQGGETAGVLVENVFSNPQPSIAASDDGNMIAAWTYDDPQKELLKAFEIAYSTYDPVGKMWSQSQMITSDNLLDFNPKLSYIGNNRVLAVWQRVPMEIENSTSPFDFAGDMELAYSILNLNTGEWSTPQLITSNNSYDGVPTLTSYGEKAQLVYLKDSDNNPFTLDNQKMIATEWTGESWSAEEIIADGITVIGSPYLSLTDATNGVLTFVRDMDDNIWTSSDRELFCIDYDGSWGTPIRLTIDNFEDRSPSIGQMNDKWYVSWIKAEPTENGSSYRASVRFAELANNQLIGTTSLLENQGVTDQFLVGEIHDELYLLYQVGARGTPMLMRYNGSGWENVANFLWSPDVENARTSQLSVYTKGDHLGVVGATVTQAGAGATTSLYASTLSLYTLTTGIEPLEGGSVTVSPSEGPYAADAKVTITASAALGYEFDHWSGDVTGTSDKITLSMDSNKNITAHFVKMTSWALIGGIAAAVVIGILIAAIFYRRKVLPATM